MKTIVLLSIFIISLFTDNYLFSYDKKQYSLLKTGVENWNDWRNEEPKIKIDLTSANLSKIDLTGANLNKSNLSKSNFIKTDLTGVFFIDSNLSFAKLNRAILSYAILDHAKLFEANLTGADLSYSNLSNADLTDAIIKDANFTEANFENTIISPKWKDYIQSQNVKNFDKIIWGDALQNSEEDLTE